MAETTTTNTVTNASAAVAISSGVANSDFAKSLLSASFDQIIQGHFYWQFSDVITLVCTTIVVVNYVQTRIEKRMQKSNASA